MALMLIQAAPAATPDDSIIVTAPRTIASERALATCLARHCPPNEDIHASIAHAQNQFLAGDYAAARKTLMTARGRNDRFARQFPEDVSDLSSASAHLASLAAGWMRP